MPVSSAPPVGELLRDWRRRRRLSQLDLSVEAEVWSRHLSFWRPAGPGPVGSCCSEQLDVPLRERNTLLLAAGYAPGYPEHPLENGWCGSMPNARRVPGRLSDPTVADYARLPSLQS